VSGVANGLSNFDELDQMLKARSFEPDAAAPPPDDYGVTVGVYRIRGGE
jgi:hypothetical protein